MALFSSACTNSGSSADFEIINTYPHDRNAFTQGLEFYEGNLLESTGLNGSTTLRIVEPETGKIIQSISRGSLFFGEGLTVVDDLVIQLTYQENVAFRNNLVDGEIDENSLEDFTYVGEGWGICYDSIDIIKSDGSDILTFHDTKDFSMISTISITDGDESVININELECVGEHVFANVWKTSTIIKIDPTTGVVIDKYDLSDIAKENPQEQESVLNGIAYNEETGNFWITGKLWPNMYEVKLK